MGLNQTSIIFRSDLSTDSLGICVDTKPRSECEGCYVGDGDNVSEGDSQHYWSHSPKPNCALHVHHVFLKAAHKVTQLLCVLCSTY